MNQAPITQASPVIQSFTPLMWVGLALFCFAATLPFMMLPVVFVIPPIAGAICCLMATVSAICQRKIVQLAVVIVFVTSIAYLVNLIWLTVQASD
jgi:hypothetical protein